MPWLIACSVHSTEFPVVCAGFADLLRNFSRVRKHFTTRGSNHGTRNLTVALGRADSNHSVTGAVFAPLKVSKWKISHSPDPHLLRSVSPLQPLREPLQSLGPRFSQVQRWPRRRHYSW